MNCPNCGKSPVGILNQHPGKISFSKKLDGYLTCKECQTLLRQPKNSYGIASFEKKYWIYLIGIGVGLIALSLGGGYWLDAKMQNIDVAFASLILLIPPGTYFISILLLRKKYLIVELVEQDIEKVPSEKISNKSFAAFTLYVIIAFAGLIFFLTNFDSSRMHPMAYMGSVLLIICLIMGVGVYIIRRMNIEKIEPEN